MPKLNFKSLWDNHPAPTIIEPCKSDTGQPNHVNQCAIRMGVALLKANVRVSAISVPNCGKKGHDGHTLGARKLADWMSNRSDLFGKKKPFYQSQKPAENIRGKKGVVFCSQFRGSDGYLYDHIDLWDGISQSAGKEMKYGLSAWVGVSGAVWFWELP